MKQYFLLRYWKGQRLLLLVFLLLHIIVAAVHISYQDITADEPDYYTYAARWLHGNVERSNKMFDSKTPVVAIALIPRVVQQLLNPGYHTNDYGYTDIRMGRYCMVIFTLIIAIYLFAWMRNLFGPKAWILPLLFFLFDPMVIVFSMVITSDMASGACLLAAFFHLYRYYVIKSRRQYVYFSTWFALGLLCKASLLFLFPALVVFYLLLLVTKKISFHPKRIGWQSLVTTIILLLVINLAYFGKDSFRSLSSYHFKSSAFQGLTSFHLPVPLPANYIQALDLLQYHSEIGAGTPESSYPGVYVNGQIKYKGGFWYYYLFVGMYKIPVATLLLLAAGMITAVLRLKKSGHRHWFYAWPALFFLVVLSCFNPFQLGLRHLLLIYPLLFMGIAALLHYGQRNFRYTHIAAGVLLLYMMISWAVYFPCLLAYTNEFLPDKKNVFRKINDASIDYGQNRGDLEAYLLQHPGIQQPDTIPKPGKYIVRMMQLFKEGPGSTNINYAWLLQCKPVGHYKYSMFLFDVSAADVDRINKKSRQ